MKPILAKMRKCHNLQQQHSAPTTASICLALVVIVVISDCEGLLQQVAAAASGPSSFLSHAIHRQKNSLALAVNDGAAAKGHKSARLASFSISCPQEISIHPCECLIVEQDATVLGENEEEVYDPPVLIPEQLVMTTTAYPPLSTISLLPTTTTAAPTTISTTTTTTNSPVTSTISTTTVSADSITKEAANEAAPATTTQAPSTTVKLITDAINLLASFTSSPTEVSATTPRPSTTTTTTITTTTTTTTTTENPQANSTIVSQTESTTTTRAEPSSTKISAQTSSNQTTVLSTSTNSSPIDPPLLSQISTWNLTAHQTNVTANLIDTSRNKTITGGLSTKKAVDLTKTPPTTNEIGASPSQALGSNLAMPTAAPSFLTSTSAATTMTTMIPTVTSKTADSLSTQAPNLLEYTSSASNTFSSSTSPTVTTSTTTTLSSTSEIKAKNEALLVDSNQPTSVTPSSPITSTAASTTLAAQSLINQHESSRSPFSLESSSSATTIKPLVTMSSMPQTNKLLTKVTLAPVIIKSFNELKFVVDTSETTKVPVIPELTVSSNVLIFKSQNTSLSPASTASSTESSITMNTISFPEATQTVTEPSAISATSKVLTTVTTIPALATTTTTQSTTPAKALTTTTTTTVATPAPLTSTKPSPTTFQPTSTSTTTKIPDVASTRIVINNHHELPKTTPPPLIPSVKPAEIGFYFTTTTTAKPTSPTVSHTRSARTTGMMDPHGPVATQSRRPSLSPPTASQNTRVNLTPNRRRPVTTTTTTTTTNAPIVGRNVAHGRRFTRFLVNDGYSSDSYDADSKYEVVAYCRNIQNSQVLREAIRGFRGHRVNYFVIDSCKVPPFPNDLFNGIDTRWIEMTNTTVQFHNNFLQSRT